MVLTEYDEKKDYGIISKGRTGRRTVRNLC